MEQTWKKKVKGTKSKKEVQTQEKGINGFKGWHRFWIKLCSRQAWKSMFDSLY